MRRRSRRGVEGYWIRGAEAMRSARGRAQATALSVDPGWLVDAPTAHGPVVCEQGGVKES
ncbi:hypothetical protein ABZ348_16305 [Streptomyces sp. NPDC005963]|uniref:hypothetical protein n=1 Tax=Streptomyces sp. NPDC005963 TaxID=3156721 RepID=UPI0033C8D5CD